MAYATKKLAFLRLGSSNGDVYDPPASTKGLIHNIIIHNSHAADAQTVILNYHDGTNEWELYNLILIGKETVQLTFANEGLMVDAASKLTGSSTDASITVVHISGSEES